MQCATNCELNTFDAIFIMCVDLVQGVEVRTCLLQCQPVPLPPHCPRQRLLHARHHQSQQQSALFPTPNPSSQTGRAWTREKQRKTRQPCIKTINTWKS